MYALVHFKGRNEVEVVPSSWVRDEYCYWPQVQNVRPLIIKAVSPEPAWSAYQISLRGLFETYEAAKAKLREALYATDFSSSCDERPTDRKKDARRAVGRVQLPTIPKSFPRPKDRSKENTSHASLPSISRSRSQSPGSTDSEVADTPSVSGSSNSLTDSSELDAMETFQNRDRLPFCSTPCKDPGKSTVMDMTARDSPLPEAVFQKRVLRTLQVMQMTLQDHGDMLYALGRPATGETKDDSVLIPEPFDDHSNFVEFDKCLTKAEKGKLEKELKSLGGPSVKVCVTRILNYIFTKRVGQLYSWEGRKGKEQFRSLQITPVILSAVRSNPRLAVQNDEIEATIKNWLRHAPGYVAKDMQRQPLLIIQNSK